MRLFQLTDNQLSDVLGILGAEDKVLLRQEAVYLMNTTALKSLPCAVYCLTTDAAVRGIDILEPFIALNDSQWLDLVLQAKQQF